MRNTFLLFPFIFSTTNQLLCVYNCFNIQINISGVFQEPTYASYKCKTDPRAKRCYGRITTYYNFDDLKKYISYSFGLTDHIIDQEIERLVNENGFRSIVYFLFVVEPLHDSEVVTNAYIICRTSDNCALNYVKVLFALYNKQDNPIDDILPLLYERDVTKRLSCYDYKTKTIAACVTSHHRTCISNNTDQFQQGCYSDINTKIHYAFMITVRNKYSIKKILELIVCNKNGCNEKSISKQIEYIVYNYTFGITIPFDSCQRQTFYFRNFIYLFILYFYD
jgi:hypothetical protein